MTNEKFVRTGLIHSRMTLLMPGGFTYSFSEDEDDCSITVGTANGSVYRISCGDFSPIIIEHAGKHYLVYYQDDEVHVLDDDLKVIKVVPVEELVTCFQLMGEYLQLSDETYVPVSGLFH